MVLINVKCLWQLANIISLESYYTCYCRQLYKPFNFSDRKEQDCISLGETSSCTIKPRMFCLRTWSHNNTSTIAEAENAGIFAPLIPNCSSTAAWVPLSFLLPKHYATTLIVSLPDILSNSLLASVSVKPKYLSKCLVGMPYAASSECHFLSSMVILG